MRIAIPVYHDSVSNVFDFARQLLLVDIEDGREKYRSTVMLDSDLPPQRVARLKNLSVDVVICGAVSRALAHWVMASGIEILPYVTGSVEPVLGAYIAGQLVEPKFVMPGCWPGARRGFGRRRRGCFRRGQKR